MTADRGSWLRAGHCVKLNPTLLRLRRPAAPTQELCRSCPVQPTCLGWALVVGADQGIVGGIKPARRRRLRADLLRRLAGRPIPGSPELAEHVSANTSAKDRPSPPTPLSAEKDTRRVTHPGEHVNSQRVEYLPTGCSTLNWHHRSPSDSSDRRYATTAQPGAGGVRPTATRPAGVLVDLSYRGWRSRTSTTPQR